MELEVQRVYKKKLPFRRMGKGGERMKFKDINLLSLAIAIFIWDKDTETIVEKLKASLKKED